MRERADENSEGKPPRKSAARSERLADALRENLRKRKAQARERSDGAKRGDGRDQVGRGDGLRDAPITAA